MGSLKPCVACQSTSTSVIRSRVSKDGKRWRLVRCHNCGHCTDYVGGKPLLQQRRRRFDDAGIRQILLSAESHSAVAAKHGCTRELIRQIRIGKVYRSTLPDVPRWIVQKRGPVCTQCKHWADEVCEMGFPDPIDEGVGFAADCSMYERRAAA